LPGDIVRALVAGILIAGLIAGLIPEDSLGSYLGGGIVAMLLMMVIGTPIYVCSTASIPIALGFIHLGASPGAALVFLITGPATNAATISVMWKILGRRTAFVYLLTVLVGSLAAGFSLDLVYSLLGTSGHSALEHTHVHALSWLNHALAILLLLLLAHAWYRRRETQEGEISRAQEEESLMTDTIRLKVTGMSCSHCVQTVARTLRETPGVSEASVSLEDGRATIRGKDLSAEALAGAVRKLGYEAEVLMD
jgi:copper chaperone CopZ